jgi:hypothetical protein
MNKKNKLRLLEAISFAIEDYDEEIEYRRRSYAQDIKNGLETIEDLIIRLLDDKITLKIFKQKIEK